MAKPRAYFVKRKQIVEKDFKKEKKKFPKLCVKSNDGWQHFRYFDLPYVFMSLPLVFRFTIYLILHKQAKMTLIES